MKIKEQNPLIDLLLSVKLTKTLIINDQIEEDAIYEDMPKDIT